MIVEPVRIEQYLLLNGKSPFGDWINSLADIHTQQIIYKRLAKVETGNFGDFKQLNEISELRIDYGPGYRIYFGKKEKRLVILLVGGSKKSQQKDIATAKAYWKDFNERSKRRTK